MPVLPRALRVPLVPLAAALLALAVWTTANLQRRAATRGAERVAVAQSLLTAMLDQETGLRGYLLTRDLDFLEPYTGGRDRYMVAARRIDALVAGDSRSEAAEDRADALAARWQRAARVQVARVTHSRPEGIDIPAAHERKSIMDAYRRAQAALVADLEARRAADQRRGAYLSALIAALVLLVAGGLATSVQRRRRRFEQARDESERRYIATQTEFAEVLSVVPSEQEAHDLLQRHLVRTEPGREVTVLGDGQPPQCVAMRLGRAHEEDGSGDALVQCDLCGKQGASAC